ncbi:TlpA disulfide reductase family protein [Pedobacter frigidisoli]|uniref:TlpA family protein disulfide reductase n=1 Tax=Pedobacter frigidisoli TaxID=2530455 RepID=UPI0029301925|nr:TlpA disulfide reductase family protein [Pedobacter frigidisoli]
MKFLNRSFLFLTMVLTVSFANAQEPNHLTILPQKAYPGQPVELSYNPIGTPLQNSRTVSAIVYQYIRYDWKASKLNFKRTDNNFEATFTPDSQATLAALKFMAGEATDNNNDNGYFIMLYNKDNKSINLPGTFAAWGLLRYPTFGYGVPNYFKKYSISDTALTFNLQQELRYHPQESGVPLALTMAKWINLKKQPGSQERIEKIVSFLKKNGTEEALWRAWKIEASVLMNKHNADSLNSAILAKFPKGNMKKLLDYTSMLAERDQKRKNQLATAFIKDYPQQNTDQTFDKENYIKYPTIYLAIVLTSSDPLPAMESYLDELPYATLIDLYYKLIQIAHSRKDVPDERLYPYSLKIIKRLEFLKNTVPNEFWYMTPYEWEEKFSHDFAMIPLINHVNIARNTNHPDEALRYAEQAEKILNFTKANLNDDYTALLNASKEYAKLHEALEKSVFQNQSTEAMLTLLKADYQRNNKSMSGFEEYFNRLKDSDRLNREKEQIASTEVSKKMPDFSMESTTGKRVSLSSLKGKTVVLDFWATWCVPCKAAFPGMKIAVDHYKNDPTVAFYFVDTEEFKEGYQDQVAKFIIENNYPFNILFDNKLPGGKQNDEVFKKICETFTLSGIPLKLIIDANGTLRFISTGYNGSPTGLADEIINMVELAKKIK